MKKIYICLKERKLRLQLGGGRKIELLFAGRSRYFYLLFIALVARRMKELASSTNTKPFVQFGSVAGRAMALAARVKGQGHSDIEKLASTMYQTWHSRLVPPGKCVFEPDHDLSDAEEVAIESLFDKRKGKAGMAAEYRLNRPVRDIVILGEEVLDEMLSPESQSQTVSSFPCMYQHIPDKPYYESLDKHETLLRIAASALGCDDSGHLLQLWGMGGIGKSTIAAELARRLTREKGVKAVQWICVETPSGRHDAENSSLRSQVLNTLLAQLGLWDRLNEPLEVQLEGIRRCGILAESLVVIDNVDPHIQAVDDLMIVVEKIRPMHVVITARPNLDLPDSVQLNIQPLDCEDGVRFLRVDAAKRGIAHVLPDDDRDLNDMCQVVGGVPFALQLALGQATRVPWRRVVEGLAGTYPELYYYLFRDLWRALGGVAKKVLVYMRTASGSIEIAELTSASEIGSPSEIVLAVNELAKLALINVIGVGTQSATYGIHPLTRNFVVSDLPRMWSEEDGNEP